MLGRAALARRTSRPLARFLVGPGARYITGQTINVNGGTYFGWNARLAERDSPTWIIAIGVIVVLQTVSATLGRLVPVAAPAFTAEFGWDKSWVGYLSAASIVGALFVLTAGIGLMHRLGGVRALQIEPADRRVEPAALSRAVDRAGAARQRLRRAWQRHRQSGGQRGAAALHAARAPQPRVLDQAGRCAARRRHRRPCDPAADRGDGLAACAPSSSLSLRRRDPADLAVPIPHRSAARADGCSSA